MPRKEFSVFLDGKETKLCFRMPNNEDLEEADRVYAAKVSSLIREGGGKNRLVLRQEVDKFLTESGIWTTDDQKKLDKLNDEIYDLFKVLKRGGIKKKDGRKTAIAIMDKRKEILGIVRKRQLLDSSTIESIAENERNDYFIYSCTNYADSGKQYWESFDDMKNDKLGDIYRQSGTAAMETIYGVSNDFEQQLPENKWLKKYGYIDDQLNYIDPKSGQKVDRDGNLLEESQKRYQKQIEVMVGDIEPEQPFTDDE